MASRGIDAEVDIELATDQMIWAVGPDSDREAGSEGKRMEEAVKKVGEFVEEVFDGKVPPGVRERLDLLPHRISVSDEVIEDELAGNDWKSDDSKRMLAAFYDPEKDCIYARSNSSLRTMIHEGLHFVSTHRNEGISGIRTQAGTDDWVFSLLRPESVDPKSNKTNEAMTEIFSLMIEAGISVKDPLAIYKVTGRFDSLRDSGEIRTATAYQDYVDNFLAFVRSSLKHEGIFMGLGQSYLLNDSQGFDQEINSRAPWSDKLTGRLLGATAAERLRREVGVEGRNAWEAFKMIVSVTKEGFVSDPRFSEEQKKVMVEFCDGLERSDKYDIRYVYPESNPNYLASDPKIGVNEGALVVVRGGYTETPTQITVSLDLVNFIVPIAGEDERGEPMKINQPFEYVCQIEAYLLWQGVKLKYIEDNNIKYDPVQHCPIKDWGSPLMPLADWEVYQHPMMQDYLSRLSGDELAVVQKTFAMLIEGGYEKGIAGVEKIMRMRQERYVVEDDRYWVLDKRIESDRERAVELIRGNNLMAEQMLVAGNYVYIPKIEKWRLEKIY